MAIFLAGPESAGYAIDVDPLRILVVDEQVDMALPVMDALSQRGHRCELQGGAQAALAAMATRREAGRPYQVVIANAALPDLDPVDFLRTMRDRRESCAAVLYAVMAQLDRAVFEAAAALDARFLDLPIDRARLVLLVESQGEAKPAERRPGGEQPFFGTGRITRPTPASGRYVDPPAGAEATSSRTSRTSHPIVPPMPSSPAPEPHSHRTTRTPLPHTGNVVRQGTDRFAGSGKVPTTQRVRRGVTGRIERPVVGQPPTAPGLHVACAICRREFVVEARAQSYNVVCVHCGKLNRIEPRPA